MKRVLVNFCSNIGGSSGVLAANRYLLSSIYAGGPGGWAIAETAIWLQPNSKAERKEPGKAVQHGNLLCQFDNILELQTLSTIKFIAVPASTALIQIKMDQEII